MGKLTASEQKQHNQSLILSTIYFSEQISRVQLASLTELSRPTVTEITQELIEAGLIKEVGPGPVKGTVGRHPKLLTFNPDAYHLIAVDVGGTTVSCALMNLRGAILHQEQITFDRTSTERAIANIGQLIEIVVKRTKRPLLSIGVGVPGRIESETGTVCIASNLAWSNVPLKRILSERFRLPVYVENDTNLAALGEYRFGQHRSTESLVVIMLGTGIGAGVVVNGEIVKGNTLGAGEIGHFVFREIDELCNCGRCGCLETVSSGWGLAARARQVAETNPQSLLNRIASNADIDALAIQRAAEEGDADAITLIERAGEFLGLAITYVIQFLNPGHIALAGSLTRLGSHLFDPMWDMIEKNTLPEERSETQIVLSTLGDRIVLLGAAATSLEKNLGIRSEHNVGI